MENLESSPDLQTLIPFFIEHSSQPFAIADPYGKITFVNRACCDTLGYTRDELLSMDWARDLTPSGWSDIESGMLIDIHRTGKPVRYEKEYLNKNGTRVPVELLVHLIRDDSGKPLYYYTFVTDLTERKLAEKKLQQSLFEKEILMKELQHRVKNNLNIIVSLLDLELDKINDEKTKRVFISARSRIISMSTIYERLYTTGQVDRVDMASYISEIVRFLSGSYIVDPSKIAITADLETVMLDMRRAVPVGLIINEAVSNALKYAFPANRSGVIKISLKKENESAILDISDNGAGLPAGFDLEKNASMGLTLINILAEQIHGRLSITRTGGTGVTITFRL